MKMAYWECAQKRMEWCRQEARAYYEKSKPKKYYKVSYIVDPGLEECFAHFGDKDYKMLVDFYEGIKADEDNNEFEDEDHKQECIEEGLQELPIFWENYLPEDAFHWAGYEYPKIVGVDFDDCKSFYKFKVVSDDIETQDPDDLHKWNLSIPLSDEMFVKLLAAKLFIPKLSYYDLRRLDKDIFDYLEGFSRFRHRHYMVFMEDINKAAVSIIEGKTEEELPQKVPDNIFSGIILSQIINDKELKQSDTFLMNSIRLSM